MSNKLIVNSISFDQDNVNNIICKIIIKSFYFFYQTVLCVATNKGYRIYEVNYYNLLNDVGDYQELIVKYLIKNTREIYI